MEEEEESVIGLSAMMKMTGLLPLLLGTLILITPKSIMAVGPYISEYGIYVSHYVAALAIVFGLTHWVASIYVKENLHIFGRLFVSGHLMIALLDIYGWVTGLIEFQPRYIFGTMFPISCAFVLLLYSISPEQTETDTINEN